jgi:hypothetical protein
VASELAESSIVKVVPDAETQSALTE